MTEPEQHGNAEGQSRYRTLLKISSAAASQPNVDAVLRSLAGLLSNVVAFESVALLLLDGTQQQLILRALERGVQDPGIEIGAEIPYVVGTAVARAIEEQVAVFVPDAKQEMMKAPDLATRTNPAALHSAYVFPVSTFPEETRGTGLRYPRKR